MSYDLAECCPKCERPECMGDCGLYNREEKEDFLEKRYLSQEYDGAGRKIVKTPNLIRNPQDKIKLGSYSQKTKKKKK